MTIMTQDAKLVNMLDKVFCRGPGDKSIAMTQHVNFLHMLNRPYGFEGSRGVNLQHVNFLPMLNILLGRAEKGA